MPTASSAEEIGCTFDRLLCRLFGLSAWLASVSQTPGLRLNPIGELVLDWGRGSVNCKPRRMRLTANRQLITDNVPASEDGSYPHKQQESPLIIAYGRH